MSTILSIFLLISLAGTLGVIIFFFIKNKNVKQKFISLFLRIMACVVLFLLFFVQCATTSKGSSDKTGQMQFTDAPKPTAGITLAPTQTIIPIITVTSIPDFHYMIKVEGGNFMMGSETGDSDEQPVHEVRLDTFYLGKYEVTQEQYLEFCNETKTNWPVWMEPGNNYNIQTGSDNYYKKFAGIGKEKCPIIAISWYNAVAYCNWLSKKEGLIPCYSGSSDSITCNFKANGYRLPTEAEWEYAARGGNKSKGYEYSGSNNAVEVAWYWNNSGQIPHAVGGKNFNELEFYDMSGNVWEWCWDWYGSYTASVLENPKGADKGDFRVERGGSWSRNAGESRSACRGGNEPSSHSIDISFRLARGQ